MKHDANKTRHLRMVTGGLLGCLPNADDTAAQPLSQTKSVTQR